MVLVGAFIAFWITSTTRGGLRASGLRCVYHFGGQPAAGAQGWSDADLRESRWRPVGSDTGRCPCVIRLDSSHRFHRLHRVWNHGFARIRTD